MGIAFACPGADVFDEFVRSISFNGEDEKPQAFVGSGKVIIEGSLDLDRKGIELSIKSPRSEKESSSSSVAFKKLRFSLSNKNVEQQQQRKQNDGSKHKAAVKLQKVYKSFRTRRQLADCAVLVEQQWWKLLEFALLRRSSISFFDVERQETAVSRWARARTRAAKVGKGLSKDEKARKLALQHWLEAIDPRHRYGHNLRFYYVCWRQCESRQPFFYWLDVGEGKEVNLEEHCPRSKLQLQCIKYLGPKEREAYEVIIEYGKLIYKSSRQLVDTTEGPKDTKWIFVLSTSKTLYVGKKKKGVFQHSSFLAGGATSAAGRLIVENGKLKAVWPHSGHYRPTEENFQDFIRFLKEKHVDLTDVKKSPAEDDEESSIRLKCKTGITSNGSEEDLTEKNLQEKIETKARKYHAPEGLMNLKIPEIVNDPFEQSTYQMKNYSKFSRQPDVDAHEEIGESSDEETNTELERKTSFKRPKLLHVNTYIDTNTEDNEKVVDSSSYMFCKQNLFLEDQEEEEEEKVFVPQEWILHRISSQKGMKPDQLGKKLSFRWTTGAGPRIGCVRDYPSQLQFRALEQVNLSPRGTGGSRGFSSPNVPASPCRKMASNIAELQYQ